MYGPVIDKNARLFVVVFIEVFRYQPATWNSFLYFWSKSLSARGI